MFSQPREGVGNRVRQYLALTQAQPKDSLGGEEISSVIRRRALFVEMSTRSDETAHITSSTLHLSFPTKPSL